MQATTMPMGASAGELRSRRDTVSRLLRERFGVLDAGVMVRLRALSENQLRDLAERLMRAPSLKELGLKD